MTVFNKFARRTLAVLLMLMLLPLSHVSATYAFPYPEGNWNQEQLIYFDYLSTGQYIDHIQNKNIQAAWRDRNIDNFYTFWDLDSDGVMELILWHGYTGADGEIQIFTIGNGTTRYAGSAPCDGTGTHLFCASHDDDFFLASYDGNSIYANSYRLIHGKLTLISEDAPIPHRWEAVDWIGSLPLIISDDQTNSAPSDSTPSGDSFAELLDSEAYAFYIGNSDLFDEWMYGNCYVKYWTEDIENDGECELLIWVGSRGEYGYVMVFANHSHWPEYYGSVPCSGTQVSISGSDTIPGFLIVSNDGYREFLKKCEFLDGKITFTEDYIPQDSDWHALEEGLRPSDSHDESAPDVTCKEQYEQFVAQGRFIDHMENRTLQKACRQQFSVGRGFMSNWYCFHDMDSDGTDELIIWWGDGTADGELMVFTYSDNKIQYLGSHACDGAGIYALFSFSEPGLVISGQAGYFERLTYLAISNNQLHVTKNFKTDLNYWFDLSALHNVHSIR